LIRLYALRTKLDFIYRTIANINVLIVPNMKCRMIPRTRASPPRLDISVRKSTIPLSKNIRLS